MYCKRLERDEEDERISLLKNNETRDYIGITTKDQMANWKNKSTSRIISMIQNDQSYYNSKPKVSTLSTYSGYS